MDKLEYTWDYGSILFAKQMTGIASLANELVDKKQDTISDLDTIKNNAYLSTTAPLTSLTLSKLMSSKVFKTELGWNSTYEPKISWQSRVDNQLYRKQKTISNLSDVRSWAALGSSVVQKSALSDMATQTYMGSTYALSTEFQAIEDKASPKSITSLNDLAYIRGYDLDGNHKKVTLDNFLKYDVLQNHAWGVVIDQSVGTTALKAVGNWNLWDTYKQNIGRYIFKLDPLAKKQKAIKLHKSDSTKTEAGEVWQSSLSKSDYNMMVLLPDLYYRVIVNANGTSTLWMSSINIGGHKFDHRYVGAFLGSIGSNYLQSITDQNPTVNTNMDVFSVKAHACGKDFGLMDYQALQMMDMIYLSEFKDRNSQNNLGDGMCGGTNNSTDDVKNDVTGHTLSLGDTCGKIMLTDLGKTTNSDTACHISLFGIEDPFGWYHQIIQGVYKNGANVYLYKGNMILDDLTKAPIGDYRQTTIPSDILSAGYGFISSLVLGDHFDIIPDGIKASAGTGWCDAISTSTSSNVFSVCGSYDESRGPGMFAITTRTHPAKSSYVSTRLAYYGTPEIVKTIELLNS